MHNLQILYIIYFAHKTACFGKKRLPNHIAFCPFLQQIHLSKTQTKSQYTAFICCFCTIKHLIVQFAVRSEQIQAIAIKSIFTYAFCAVLSFFAPQKRQTIYAFYAFLLFNNSRIVLIKCVSYDKKMRRFYNVASIFSKNILGFSPQEKWVCRTQASL